MTMRVLKAICVIALVATATACAGKSKSAKIAPVVPEQTGAAEASQPEAPNCFNPRFRRNLRTELFINDSIEGIAQGSITEHDMKTDKQVGPVVCQWVLDPGGRDEGPDIRAKLAQRGITYWRLNGQLIVSRPNPDHNAGVANMKDLYFEYEDGVGWHFTALRPNRKR